MAALGRLAVTLAACGLLVAALGGAFVLPANGADGGRILFDVAGDGEGFTPDPSIPLVDHLRLAPGLSTSGDVVVRNDSANAAEMTLQAVNVREDENECLPQETREGDDTCSEDGGELGRWLEVSLASGADGPTADRLWTGTIAALEDGVVLSDHLSAGDELQLRMTLRLPYAAGNDTMTDRIRYDLRWTATGETGEVTSEVLGTELGAWGAGTGGSGTSIDLPLTGATVGLRWVLLGLTLAFSGLTLLLVARLRRDIGLAAP